jgi:UDP-glucose 4-epimerase
MVHTLLGAGHAAVVIDDLSTGHRDAVPSHVPFVRADIRDAGAMASLLREHHIDAVINFAAKSRVEQSVSDPRMYWQGNTVATLALLEAVTDVGNVAFVQSSTAAVYGSPARVPIDENESKVPTNPYGASKLAIENALEAYGHAYGMKWAALRYFNAAGAEPLAGLGERHDPETHLIPLVLEVAEGKREKIQVYGTSWPTPDGTCVRDYIHVTDLAEAHLAALTHLMQRGGESGAFNLGTGVGHSVREVIETVRAVTGRDVRSVDAPARAGDPAVLVASVERAARVLGFRATRSALSRIVTDAWAWNQRAQKA